MGRWSSVCWLAAVVGVAGCVPARQYRFRSHGAGAEQALPYVEARVVSAAEAQQSGLKGRPVTIQFEGAREGAELVTRFFRVADGVNAELISDLAIIVETTRDGRPVACRTEIVPDSITQTQHHPGEYKTTSVQRPVQRMVSDQQFRCKPRTAWESRMRTEYQQRCSMVSRPVSRTRTVHRSEYDSFSKSWRSVPRTEFYTESQSHYECRPQPVTRMHSEMVTKQDCGMEPSTRMVTGYESRSEITYVPPRTEMSTEQWLIERDPVCQELDAAAGAPAPQTRGNRIEGRVFTRP